MTFQLTPGVKGIFVNGDTKKLWSRLKLTVTQYIKFSIATWITRGAKYTIRSRDRINKFRNIFKNIKIAVQDWCSRLSFEIDDS